MKQFEVRMKCVVEKLVTVECGTIEEVGSNPWGNCVDEIETDQMDWEVLSIAEVE
jgi:hypothetical protein